MRRFSPREINWLNKFAKPDSWREVSQTSPTSQMPVEYMTGWAEFYGRDFKINKNVLIPRLETEQIIDETKKILTSKIDSHAPISSGLGMTKTVADIGTGCGCIGITLYLELVKLGIRPTIYMSDISGRAVDISNKNISRSIKARPCEARPGLITLKSYLFNSYPEDIKFDLIIANLPYIPSSRILKLPESVKDFEPLLALDGGPDGLKLINKLIAQSRSRLKPNGVLLLEIDETHVLSDFKIPRGFQSELIKDQFGKNRFLRIKKRTLREFKGNRS